MPTHAISVDAIPADPSTGNVATTVSTSQLTVTLTDDQIKALPTTDIIVIPAQGSSKIVIPVDITYVANIIEPYDNIGTPSEGNGYAVLYLGFDGYDVDSGIQTGVFGETTYQWMQNFLQTVGKQITKTHPTAIGGLDLSGYANPWGIPANSIENKALSTDCSNSLGNFTGGHPSNTLKISVSYVVVEI